MDSCRKPELQNDLPNIHQNQVNVLLYFEIYSGQKALTMFIS